MRSSSSATALGIDIGSTNTKAVLVDVSGATVLERTVRAAPTPARAEALIDRVAQLVRSALTDSAQPPAAIGIAAMAETGAVLDAATSAGHLVRWDGSDPARAAAAAALVRAAGAEQLYRATGVPVPDKSPMAHWHRMRRDGFAGRIQWAGVADLVGWALTGVLATDHTLAQRTMAYRTAYRTHAAGRPAPHGFDADLLDLVGMQPKNLPRVLCPGERVGAVASDGAERFGVPPGIPVFIAGHDHLVGAWAAGTRNDGDAADSIGTAEALVRLTEATPDCASARAEGLSLGRDVTGVLHAVIAGNPAAGALIAALFPSLPTDTDAWSAALDPVAPTWPLLLPYPRGRQAPAPDPAARLVAIAADGTDTAIPTAVPDRYRAAMQSLALQLRWMNDTTARIAGAAPVRTVILGGPGARSSAALVFRRAVLPGILAHATAREPVASGAGLFAAVHAELADPDATLPLRPVPGTDPDPAFDPLFTRFVHAACNPRRGAP